jgi:hypothetical protein
MPPRLARRIATAALGALASLTCWSASAVAAQPIPGGHYLVNWGNLRLNDNKTVFHVDSDAGALVRMTWLGVHARCRHNETESALIFPAPVRLRADGSFSHTFVARAHSNTVTRLQIEGRFVTPQTLVGRFSGNVAFGAEICRIPATSYVGRYSKQSWKFFQPGPV